MRARGKVGRKEIGDPSRDARETLTRCSRHKFRGALKAGEWAQGRTWHYGRRAMCSVGGNRGSEQTRGAPILRARADEELTTKTKEEGRGAREVDNGQSHKETAPSTFPVPVLASCPLPFPVCYSESTWPFLGWWEDSLTGQTVKLPIYLLKHVLCFCYLITAWTGQPWFHFHHPPPAPHPWVSWSLLSSHLWQRAHTLHLLSPKGSCQTHVG